MNLTGFWINATPIASMRPKKIPRKYHFTAKYEAYFSTQLQLIGKLFQQIMLALHRQIAIGNKKVNIWTSEESFGLHFGIETMQGDNGVPLFLSHTTMFVHDIQLHTHEHKVVWKRCNNIDCWIVWILAVFQRVGIVSRVNAIWLLLSH